MQEVQNGSLYRAGADSGKDGREAAVRKLRQQGLGINKIAKQLGIGSSACSASLPHRCAPQERFDF